LLILPSLHATRGKKPRAVEVRIEGREVRRQVPRDVSYRRCRSTGVRVRRLYNEPGLDGFRDLNEVFFTHGMIISDCLNVVKFIFQQFSLPKESPSDILYLSDPSFPNPAKPQPEKRLRAECLHPMPTFEVALFDQGV